MVCASCVYGMLRWCYGSSMASRVGHDCELYWHSVRWWRMISYGSATTPRVGHDRELAAGRVRNPNTRVGLAAKSWGTGVGLAATVAELTEYIWIWLL